MRARLFRQPPRDASEFLEFAAQIPLETRVERLPLEEANTALERLKAGEVAGAFVLVP